MTALPNNSIVSDAAGKNVRVWEAIATPAIAQRRLPLIGGLLLCFLWQAILSAATCILGKGGESILSGNRKNMKKTIVLQPEKCLGCRTCELICSFSRAKEFNPQKSAVSVISYDTAMLCVPIMCTQCEDAACAAICPVKAIARDEWGAMKIDEKKCIGCKMCISACPLGNMALDSGKVFKCTLCGGDPQCAKYCPSGAIEYKSASPSSLVKKKAIAEKFKEAFGEEAF